jgi:hypothetical protein
VAHHEEVDVEKAVSVGSVMDQQNQGEDGGGHGGIGVGYGFSEADARTTAQDILLSLPGINVHNYREVMSKVINLADLSKMTEVQLQPLIGPSNAKKLVSFFRQRAA